MWARHLLWICLACLGAGCVDAITVGDASDPDNRQADIALASLALELEGEWYGRIPSAAFDMQIKMTLEPTDTPRAVAFRVECLTSDCPLAAWLASFAKLRGGFAASTEANDNDELPSGRYQLIGLLEDDSGVAASCVLLPDGAGPAIHANVWLSEDRTQLRFSGAFDGRTLELTRHDEQDDDE